MGVFSLGLQVTMDGAAPEVVTIDQRDMLAACRAGYPMPSEAVNTLERVGFLRAAAASWYARNRDIPTETFEQECAEVVPAPGGDDDPDPTRPATSDG